MIAILYPLKMTKNLSEAYSSIYEVSADLAIKAAKGAEKKRAESAKAGDTEGAKKAMGQNKKFFDYAKGKRQKENMPKKPTGPMVNKPSPDPNSSYPGTPQVMKQGKIVKSSYEPEDDMVEGYKKIDKKKENKMYRRAGNLARQSISSNNEKEKQDTAKKSANIVSAISSQKEKERFENMKTPAAQLRNEEAIDEMKKKPKVGSVIGTTKDGTKLKYAGSGKTVKQEEKEYNYVNVYLDELKKTTMGSYIAKASKDLANRRFDQGDSEKRKYEPDEADDKEDKKLDKREEGIARAAKKIVKSSYEPEGEMVKEGKFRKEWEALKLIETENYREQFDTWLEAIVEEGYEIERWSDEELIDTFINENNLWASREAVDSALLEADKKGSGSGKKDACYKKVKASASVWPSAYASGRLVQCRKKGAANYGNSSKKEDFSDWRDEIGLLDEDKKMSDKFYAIAKKKGEQRRNSYEYRKQGSFGVGKNERAAYNLAQASVSRNKDLDSQGGPQTGGGSKSFGYASNKKNPIKSKSVGDTGAIGHRKNRDQKITTKKDGKTPLKTPRYKLNMSQRVDHHSSRRFELKNPDKNPKHQANKKQANKK